MKQLKAFIGIALMTFVASSCRDWFDGQPSYLLPKIEDIAISDIKTTSMKISGLVTAVGSIPATEYGIIYGPQKILTEKDTKIKLGTTLELNKRIEVEIKNLMPGTEYFITAYVQDKQLNMASIETFKTASLQAPKVTIADATEIKFNTFSITGQITELGTSDVTEYGHTISETNKLPTEADIVTKMGATNTAPKDFKSVFTQLKANTTYYARAYAINETGKSYSEVKTVQTGALIASKVVTKTVENITINSANVGGSITEQGTNAITDFGHVISKTNQNPTTTDTKTSLGVPSSIPKDFVSTFNNLDLNTTYFVRAYSVSEAGVAYGEVKSFKTLDKTPPTVVTKEVSNISTSAGNISGLISTQGSHTITDYGHVISKINQSPTTADTKTSFGATQAPKDFVSTFNNLEANTTYYARAYALSEGGLAYGEMKSFKTLNLQPPVVTTLSATANGTNGADATGQINSLGTSTIVSDYGFCYSSSNQNPSVSDSKLGLGSTSNANLSFKASISNLTANTTYYLRAYATSSAGIAYGAVKSFKTAEIVVIYDIPTLKVVSSTFSYYGNSLKFNIAKSQIQNIETIVAAGFVETRSLDKNTLDDPKASDLKFFNRKAEFPISTSSFNNLVSNNILEINIDTYTFTGLKPTNLIVTNGTYPNNIQGSSYWSKMVGYVITQSGKIYYSDLRKNY
jgi:hypothetical protein